MHKLADQIKELHNALLVDMNLDDHMQHTQVTFFSLVWHLVS